MTEQEIIDLVTPELNKIKEQAQYAMATYAALKRAEEKFYTLEAVDTSAVKVQRTRGGSATEKKYEDIEDLKYKTLCAWHKKIKNDSMMEKIVYQMDYKHRMVLYDHYNLNWTIETIADKKEVNIRTVFRWKQEAILLYAEIKYGYIPQNKTASLQAVV